VAAHSLLANGSLVRPEIRARVDAVWAPWRVASAHILGMHLRGTDKVVAKKVPPEAYFPFVDAWIAAHPDALLFVATDERDYFDRMVRRYGPARLARGGARGGKRGGARGSVGRVVSVGRGYRTSNVIADASISAYEKGRTVLLDALLLGR
jgi:hypothetical protein